MASPVRPEPIPTLPPEARAYLDKYGPKAAASAVPPVAAESTGTAHLPPEAAAYLAKYGKPTQKGAAIGSGALGAAESTLQGLFGNFADEIGGAGAAALDKVTGQPGTFGDNYRKYRDVAREVEGNYETAHPLGHVIAQIAGGAVPALATAGGATAGEAAPLLVRAIQGAAGGALGSAVYGAGASTGDAGERLHAGVQAMPTGAILGGLFPVAGAAAQSIGKGVQHLTGAATESRAVGKVADYLSRAKMTPQDLATAGAEASANGTPAIAADLMGDPGRTLLKWTARQPSGNASALMQKLTDRNAAQYDRILTGTKAAMGQGFSNIPQTMDALLDQRRANAQPLYDAAYAKGPVMTPTLEKALQDPDFQKAIQKGQALASKRALTRETPTAAGAAPNAAIMPDPYARYRTLYHGTSGDFSAFDDKYAGSVSSGSGVGHWFTTSRPYAGEYAENAASRRGGDPRILQADLGFQKPLVVEFSTTGEPVVNGAKMPWTSNDDVLRFAKKQGHDAVIWPDGSFTDDESVTMLNPKQIRIRPDQAASSPMTDQEALYAKLLKLNGGDHTASQAAMRVLGMGAPDVASAGATATGVQPVPIEVLDYAKRYLDNGIRRGFDAQSTFDHTTATATNGLLGKVLDEVDAQVPEYAKARQVYHSDSKMMDAVDLGRKALQMPPDELAAAVQGMSPSEQEMFRAWALSAFKEKAASVNDRSDLSQQVLTNPAMRQRFQTIAPDANAYGKMSALRDGEQGLAKTFQTAKNGSDTFGNFQTDADVSGRVGAGDLAPGMISARRVAMRLTGKAGQVLDARAKGKLADALAPLLGADAGSPEFDALVQQLTAHGNPATSAAKSAQRSLAGSEILGALHGTVAGQQDQP